MTPTNTTSHRKNLNEQRRVVAATTIGTAIEWYDYFLYASVAALVFREIMFGPMDPGLATILSFLTVGISFLFRPLGAFLAGHFSDKIGRRKVLMVTLTAMGGSTTLIGILPTFESVGVWAPILLIALRIVQGLSAGGEWGSAVLMAVEHAPRGKRGLFGAGPQVGVPMGLLLSSGILVVLNAIAPGDAFMVWGWRVGFLLSILLVLIGFFIRHGVEESPVFEEMLNRAEEETATKRSPIVVLFTKLPLVVFFGAVLFAANGTVGYMTTGGYIQNYTTASNGLALERGPVLMAVTASAVTWMIFTICAGWISDKIGRKNTFIFGFSIQAIGAAALFPLVNTGNIWLIFIALAFLTVGLGFTYGQVSATFAEIYPTSVRGSGASITYALGSVLGGAFSPMIAAALYNATGTSFAISGYLVTASLVGLVVALILQNRTDIPLAAEYEPVQSSGHFVWQPSWRVALTQFDAEETRTADVSAPTVV